MKYKQKRYNYLIRAGFLALEARELSHTSTEGMKAPYFQLMVKSRRGLKMNAIKYGWSDYRYRKEIRRQYVAKGIIAEDERWHKNKVWELLRWYEFEYPVPDEYESPWRKRAGKKQKVKRQQKRIGRREMLRSWIADLDRSIARARTEKRRAKLQEQKAGLEAQLSRME